MSAGQNLRGIRIQRAVVNVQEASDQTGKGRILGSRLDSRVSKEEGTGDQGTNRHGVFAAKQFRVAHEACDDGARNTADVGEAVVAPSFEDGTVEDCAVVCKICTVNLS